MVKQSVAEAEAEAKSVSDVDQSKWENNHQK